MTTNTGKITVDYVKTIGLTSNSPTGRGFANPVDLAITSDGRILVINRGAYEFSRITVCNLEEDFLGEIGSNGAGDGQFTLPTSITVDSKDNIYVADEYLNRVTVFDPTGNFLTKWGARGSESGDLSGPSGLAIDGEDNLYLVDQRNNRVQKFTTDGNLLCSWGEPGSGPGQLDQPWGICIDSSGDVLVADWRNDRIQKFAPDGKPIMQFGESGSLVGQLSRPSDVAVTDDQHIIVSDWGNERVQVFDTDGRFELLLQGQATLSKWADDFFAANPDEARVRAIANLEPELPDHLQTPYHIAAQTEPYFWGPTSVNIDADRHLYVTESARHRFQVYSF